MPWDVRYIEDERIISIETKGPYSFEDMREQTEIALELDRKHDVHRFLSDIREVTDVPSFTELFEMPAMYDLMGAQRINKMAVIAPESSENEGAFEFFETICVNRGWDVKFFHDRESAVKWLHPDR